MIHLQSHLVARLGAGVQGKAGQDSEESNRLEVVAGASAPFFKPSQPQFPLSEQRG